MDLAGYLFVKVRGPSPMGNAEPRTFYKVVGVVKTSLGNTSPPRAGSGVKGAPRSGAFIVDP